MLRVVPSVPKYIVIQKICLWCLMNELRNLTFHRALARGSVWHILPHSILMVTLWRNGSLERFYDLLRAMQLDGVRNQAQFSEFRVHITAAHEAPRCIFRKMLVSRVLLFKSSGAKESESKKFCKWVIRWNCCWWSGLTHALLPRCVCVKSAWKHLLVSIGLWEWEFPKMVSTARMQPEQWRGDPPTPCTSHKVYQRYLGV